MRCITFRRSSKTFIPMFQSLLDSTSINNGSQAEARCRRSCSRLYSPVPAACQMILHKALNGSHWQTVSIAVVISSDDADLRLEHEECFLDTPRLSTVQALLLLLKAREAAPKRGYYYRSWITCKTIVSMAKDLELHEHYATHQTGEACGSDPVECLNKTRVWQTILMCEMMVGAPQGMIPAVAAQHVD